MKKIMALILTAIFIFSLTACGGNEKCGSEKEKITLVLDWTPNTNHTGFYVADSLGFYADEGIEISIVQPPEDGAYSLLAAGKAEFCIGVQETMAAALTSSSPLGITAVAAIVDHNTSGMISSKDKGITSFKKLEGHNYATWETPLEKEVIQAAMEKEGGDVSKLEFIPSTVTDVMAALSTDIDTVWVYEGWDVCAANVKGVEYNFIKFSDILPELDYYTPVLTASDEFLKNSPELAKKFVAATKKGYDYAEEHPDEAAGILVKAVPELDYELVLESQRFLSKEYRAEKNSWGTIDAERWSGFYKWAYEKGLVSENLGVKGFTNDFLPQNQ